MMAENLYLPDGYKEALDEEIRLKEESCPGCGADLGTEIEAYDECPKCGEPL